MSENEGELKAATVQLSEEDAGKYGGQNVCVPSFRDHTVVAAHLDATIALKNGPS